MCSQTKGAFTYYSHIVSAGKRKLFPSAHVIFTLSKARLQTHCRSPSIGKDMPAGMFLKDKPFRNTPHLSRVVATHISSSSKKQNENMITQAWKQTSRYYCYVSDTLTSAELRKLEGNKGVNCKGKLLWAACVQLLDVMKEILKGWNKVNSIHRTLGRGKGTGKPFLLHIC